MKKILFSIIFLANASFLFTQNLIAHYPFDGNAQDMSGNNNHGIIAGNISPSSDRFGNPNAAFYFDGIDDFIESTSNDFNFGTGDFTISFWFNRESEGNHFLISKDQSGDATSNRYGSAILSNPLIFSDKNKVFYREADNLNSSMWNSQNGFLFEYSNPIILGEWYHMVHKREGLIHSLYINDVLVSTLTLPSIIDLQNNYNFRIGARYANNGTNDPAELFQGNIDDIYVYDYAINQSEITNLFNSDASTFVKTLGGSGDEAIKCAIPTNDGNYLAVGYTTTNTSGDKDFLITKLNADANIIWSKSMGGALDDVCWKVIQLSDDDYIISGYTHSYGSGDRDGILIRMEDDGNIVWSKTIGGTLFETGATIIETSDENILLCGTTRSFGAGQWDMYAMKLDFDGQEIWTKTLGTTTNDWINSGVDISENSTGEFLLSWSTSRSYGSNLSGGNGIFIKLDSDGNMIFSKAYGTNENDDLQGLAIQNANSYQVIGRTWASNNNLGLWISDLDFNGNVNWSKTYGLQNTNLNSGGICITEDKDYVIGLFHYDSIEDAYLVKIDALGNLIWAKEYGGTGNEDIQSIIQTNTGFIAFGSSNSYSPGDQDMLIIKTDINGDIDGTIPNANIIEINISPYVADPTFNISTFSACSNQTLNLSNIDFYETLQHGCIITTHCIGDCD